MSKRYWKNWLILFLLIPGCGFSTHTTQQTAAKHLFSLTNQQISLTVAVDKQTLVCETLAVLNQTATEPAAAAKAIEMSGDFKLDIMWTDWRAPGKVNNGDLQVLLTKADFAFVSHTLSGEKSSDQQLQLLFAAKNGSLKLKIDYSLKSGDFYIRRRIGIMDQDHPKHFLNKIAVIGSELKGDCLSVVKCGGFGQPIALIAGGNGVFTGVENPASSQSLHLLTKNSCQVDCSQLIGRKIGNQWLESDWAVIALTPDCRVKHWFFTYLDDIRITPVKPYTLYNSWYDLRARDYPSKTPTQAEQVMNETNVRRMIQLIRDNMIQKYGIALDAFVLDDGWDTYASDWQLRQQQFPNGLLPIAAELKKTDTALGIWFGPTGGYSARKTRIDWMKAHGYETVGLENDWHREMLCLGGKNYSRLFKQRVTEMVKKEHVGYFKWDGIQFSCSEADHGHAIGVFSVPAILSTLIDICQTVRQFNPDIYLNITSGTWLSPWWLSICNQIWMDGEDYGYANVPGISPRDSAITYRDVVLYNDFNTKDLWFPISNLMTHGIIKGNLQKLGGETEPIDKFTNNALLYFARGVSMWELYISPDLLSPQEWYAISQSIAWAKDRFELLKHTCMIGGDPGNREPYGYVHFYQHKGLAVLRNPFIGERSIEVPLTAELGFAEYSASIVMERIYPNRWVSPVLYASGAKIPISLAGYETAIYEFYPLDKAAAPLLAGAVFVQTGQTDDSYAMDVFAADSQPRLLNPEIIQSLSQNGQPAAMQKISCKNTDCSRECWSHLSITPVMAKKHCRFDLIISLEPTVAQAELAVLLEAANGAKEIAIPDLTAMVNLRAITGKRETQAGKWAFDSIPLTLKQNQIQLKLTNPAGWQGNISLWLIGTRQINPDALIFTLNAPLKKERPLPPLPFPPNQFKFEKRIHFCTI